MNDSPQLKFNVIDENKEVVATYDQPKAVLLAIGTKAGLTTAEINDLLALPDEELRRKLDAVTQLIIQKFKP